MQEFIFQFLTAILAKPVEFKDMVGNKKAFFFGFFCITILHGTNIYAFRFAAFCTDDMMVMMSWLNDFIDIAGRAVDFMNDADFCKQGEIAIDGVEGYAGVCFAYDCEDLLSCGKVAAFGEGLKYSLSLRCEFVAFGAQQR